MKTLHHPSEAQLLDYASGTLAEGWSLAIATHLAFCPDCRNCVAHWEAVSGSLLQTAEPDAVRPDMIDDIFAKIDQQAGGAISDIPSDEDERYLVSVSDNSDSGIPVLPQPLRNYVGGDVDSLNWLRLGVGAYQLLIPLKEKGTTARLLKIPAGKPVPKHTHRGLELTLVLAGSFSDTTGTYERGDLQEADNELEHQPLAGPGEDCICLAITDAPLRFDSIIVKMLQPILGI